MPRLYEKYFWIQQDTCECSYDIQSCRCMYVIQADSTSEKLYSRLLKKLGDHISAMKDARVDILDKNDMVVIQRWREGWSMEYLETVLDSFCQLHLKKIFSLDSECQVYRSIESMLLLLNQVRMTEDVEIDSDLKHRIVMAEQSLKQLIV